MTQMKGIWGRLDGGQRLVVAAVVLATLAGMGGIVWFAGQPSYVNVFYAKSPDEIQRARQALQQAGVSYVEDSSGFGFMVDQTDEGKARAAINQEGLVGTQIPSLDGATSLIEDAATKAWKLDAVSRAQAAAAIESLQPVIAATVSASRPRSRVAFRDRQREQRASATVVLRLRPGVTLESIAHSAASIASSQLMIPMENIEVVNSSSGRRWRYDPNRETGGGTAEFLALQRNLSDERTREAQQELDRLWPGKVSVRVNVELDPNWEVRTEKVVPDQAIVRSEEIQKDSTDAQTGQSDDQKNTSKNETKSREFVTEIGERRTGKMMPEIKRITVAGYL